MTWSAPIDRTRSAFVVLHTPVTSAPNALAICTANEPTPPAAPMISTFCPGRTSPLSRRAWSAVTPEMGAAAACSKVSLGGFGTSLSGRAMASSAKEPSTLPITSSPGRNAVTAEPTASTRPATSQPRTLIFGLRNPTTRRAKYGFPVMRCHTSGPQPAARTRTSTSFSPATGAAISLNSKTSAEPYSLWTIAFIVSLPRESSGGRFEQQRLHTASDPALLVVECTLGQAGATRLKPRPRIHQHPLADRQPVHVDGEVGVDVGGPARVDDVAEPVGKIGRRADTYQRAWLLAGDQGQLQAEPRPVRGNPPACVGRRSDLDAEPVV